MSNGSGGSLAKCAAASPTQSLVPLELSVFLAEPGQFSPLLAGELTLIRGAEITSVNEGLAHPLYQAAEGMQVAGPQPCS